MAKDQDQSKTNKEGTQGLKEAKQKLREQEKEINSLKDLVRNLELVTRDLNTEKQTSEEKETHYNTNSIAKNISTISL